MLGKILDYENNHEIRLEEGIRGALFSCSWKNEEG